MPEPNEIQRIAAAMNALRPDWNPRSLVTFLRDNHGTRSYRDLAIAAVAVATDPKTKTPRLLDQHGPWWAAAQTVRGGPAAEPLRFERCPIEGHTSYPIDNCGACKADRLAVEGEPVHQAPRTPRVPPERVRQILEAATDPEPDHHPHDDARTRAAGKD